MNVRSKCLVWIAALLMGTSANAQSPEVVNAIKTLDADRLGSARVAFEGIASAAPTAENQFYLGYYYLRVASTEDVDSPKIAELLGKAKAAFEKGNTADPKFLLNNVGLGGVMLGMNKLADAKTLLNGALTTSKNKDENVLYRAAEMYTLFDKANQANDPAEAIRLIDAINLLKKKSPNPEYQIVKGDAYLIKNDGGPAVSAYEEALRLQNSPALAAKAYTRMGKVWKRGKNYINCQNSYNDGIKADPTYAPVYWEFAELWLRAGNYKNAAENLDRYIQNSEETPEVILRYVKFAFLARQYEKTLAALDKIKDKVSDSDIPRIAGWSNSELKNYQAGVDNLEKLVASNPKKMYAEDYRYLGQNYRELKNDSMAVVYFDKAAPIDTIYNNNDEIAKIRSKQKRHKEAIGFIEKSIAWKGTRPDQKVSYSDFYRIGTSYYYSKDTLAIDKASAAFTKMAELGETFLTTNAAKLTDDQKALIRNTYINDSHLWLARLRTPLADRKQALPFYEKFTTVADPEKGKKGLVEAYRFQAFYFLVNKDKMKADEMFAKILAIDPENADAKKYMSPPAGSMPPPPSPATAPVAKPKTGK